MSSNASFVVRTVVKAFTTYFTVVTKLSCVKLKMSLKGDGTWECLVIFRTSVTIVRLPFVVIVHKIYLQYRATIFNNVILILD